MILPFEVCGLMEMQRWILQGGEQAEAMEPLYLREAIRKRAVAKAARDNKKKTRG